MSDLFIFTRKDDSTSGEVGAKDVVDAAANRLDTGAGPFSVFRGEYRHPNLTRAEALGTLTSMLERTRVGDRIRIEADRTVVFVCRRVAASVYDNPLRDCAGLRPLRIDQGVDYSVSRESPVYAIGPGVVRTYRTTSGWPWTVGHPDGGAYIAYELTDGPAQGRFIYDAEHIRLSPKLKVGSHVDATIEIATHLVGFANCEKGWAAPPSGYSPWATTYYNEGDRTWHGQNFSDFMEALGAPAGLTEGRSIRGNNSGGFPTDWHGRL